MYRLSAVQHLFLYSRTIMKDFLNHLHSKTWFACVFSSLECLTGSCHRMFSSVIKVFLQYLTLSTQALHDPTVTLHTSPSCSLAFSRQLSSQPPETTGLGEKGRETQATDKTPHQQWSRAWPFTPKSANPLPPSVRGTCTSGTPAVKSPPRLCVTGSLRSSAHALFFLVSFSNRSLGLNVG